MRRSALTTPSASHFPPPPPPPFPPSLQSDDGDYVTLVPGYKAFSDAGRGPLSLARTESAFGMVVLASGDRLRVRGSRREGEWKGGNGARPGGQGQVGCL
jgi:hypothetical protein